MNSGQVPAPFVSGPFTAPTAGHGGRAFGAYRLDTAMPPDSAGAQYMVSIC